MQSLGKTGSVVRAGCAWSRGVVVDGRVAEPRANFLTQGKGRIQYTLSRWKITE